MVMQSARTYMLPAGTLHRVRIPTYLDQHTRAGRSIISGSHALLLLLLNPARGS
jgi:hypothetical protein